jgi:outer membrane protein insertion porin family
VRTLAEFILGAYNQDRVVLFERFYLGGDGLANFSIGRETIQLRGYPNNSLTPC